jgi:hypothetical protein
MLQSPRTFWFRVKSLVRRRQLDADLTEEMNLHRELLAEDGSILRESCINGDTVFSGIQSGEFIGG